MLSPFKFVLREKNEEENTIPPPRFFYINWFCSIKVNQNIYPFKAIKKQKID